ncbi:DUF2199 domain-containing protein [Pontibacter sp. 172403-2]|uniref:DUF2199 domain-containing protein n=1 Tax=Pontibacter rufus TaxID=2791028 RepID=UPI0018AF9475|nr:DUF2199 domain-containing protein [Pontibacter sp. 172403-2]MBF9252895.1 DUF2199 domain-containing protein [Pontibacter sp. 172403-2]
MKYNCTKCEKEHDSWPALAYSSPIHYQDLSEDRKEAIATISSDFCTIEYDDGTDRFIRCSLTLKVNNHCEGLDYGAWVSLSEKSFKDYQENYNDPEHETSYFGYLCNNLAGYDETINVPTTVVTRAGNLRPEIIPHEDFEHDLVKDYYSGISKTEAERRIKEVLKNIC